MRWHAKQAIDPCKISVTDLFNILAIQYHARRRRLVGIFCCRKRRGDGRWCRRWGRDVLIFQASQADNSQRFRAVKKGGILMLCRKMRPFIWWPGVFLRLTRKRKGYFQNTFLYCHLSGFEQFHSKTIRYVQALSLMGLEVCEGTFHV